MEKRAKRRRNLELFTLPHDSEEYLLLETQVRKEAEEYRKSKGEAGDIVKKEVLDNKDFQKQVISMLGHIVEKMSKLEMNQSGQAKQLNDLNKKLKALS